MELTIDFESRSPVDIKKCGAYVYWQNPRTEILMLAVKVDRGPSRLWIPPEFRKYKATEILDRDLLKYMDEADIVIAHNAGFERLGFQYGMRRFGFKPIPLEKIRCTMSQALMCGFPRNLEAAAKCIFDGEEEKDKVGHNLMKRMVKPRALTKKDAMPLLEELVYRGHLPHNATWEDVKSLQAKFVKDYARGGYADEEWLNDAFLLDNFLVYRENEEDFRRLAEYARQDVHVSRRIYDTLPRIPESELKVYQWSETVNDRGVGVDREMIKAIRATLQKYSVRLMKRVAEITGGAVSSMKAPQAIRDWLLSRGIDIPSVRKDDVDYMLSLDLPDDVREFLQIRKTLGRSSIAKYDALLSYSAFDGRFRGGFVWHAAGTGRFGGAGPQPQNFPRISSNNSAVMEEAHPTYADAQLLATGDLDLIEMFWKDLTLLASDLLRTMLRAGEGKEFESADYSAVEARGLAWIAGEEASLEGFRKGLDFYKVAASGIYHIPYEEVDGGGKGPQRQVGKTAVLACGYGGGYNAMLRFGADRMGIGEEEGNAIVKAWRASNPNIVKLWYDLQKGSMKAMRFPGRRVFVRPNVSFLKTGKFLTMKLPSGRNIFYPFPELRECEMPWVDDEGWPVKRLMVTAMTLTASKQWVRRPLSHVTLTENLVQGLCRDLLVNSGMNLDYVHNIPTVMHVHDEVVSEIDEGTGNLNKYEGIMAQLPDWAKGFPLKAEGWIDVHYRK